MLKSNWIANSTVANRLMMFSALLFFGCQKSSSDSSKPAAVSPAKTTHPVSESDLNTVELTTDAMKRLGLVTAAVEMRAMPRMRSYGAELVLPTGASIIVSTPIAGTLQHDTGQPFPQPGQQVKEGETFIRLLPMLSPEREVLTPAERIQLAEARNAVAQSQNDAAAQVQQSTVQVEAAQIALERAERLLKDKSGTVRAVDEANAQLKLAEATMQAAIARREIVDSIKLDAEAGTLQLLAIKMPMTGMLRSIQAQPGQMLASGAPLFEVMNDRKLWVRVPVYVGDIEDLDLKSSAQVTLPNGRPSGKEITVDPVAAPPTALALSSTVDLYFDLANPDSTFRAGQKVGVQVKRKGEEKSLAIPWSSVYHDIHGNQWVYIKTDERQFVRRRVDVAFVMDGWAALSRGPNIGDQVVTAGVAELAGTEFGFAK